jgi:hypothetical protein
VHQGSCHCGQVAFDIDMSGEPSQVMECNCSHCSRKGYLLWFVPRDKFKLKTSEAAMTTYTFNTHRIRHHFCPKCGCAPFGLGVGPNGAPMAAVNVRCLENVELTAIKRVPFDGRRL